MGSVENLSNALYTLLSDAVGSSLAEYPGISSPLIVHGYLPDNASFEGLYPAIGYRLSSLDDSFSAVVDTRWIVNVYAETAFESATIANAVVSALRDAKHVVTFGSSKIACNTEARVVTQVPDIGVVNTPVEVRVYTIGG